MCSMICDGRILATSKAPISSNVKQSHAFYLQHAKKLSINEMKLEM